MIYYLLSCIGGLYNICLVFLLMLLDGMAVILIADLVISVIMISTGFSVLFLVILVADLIMVLLGIWL